MAQDLSEDHRGLLDVLPQSHELLSNILDVLESVVWVLAQQLHNDVDHII